MIVSNAAHPMPYHRLSPLAWTILLLIALALAAAAAPVKPSIPRIGPDADRWALVIGNANYVDHPLRNPGNDARDMAATLRELGFRVDLREDLDLPKMRLALRKFGQRLNAGSVGLFYYAGHGSQEQQRNFLIPVGKQGFPDDLANNALTLSAVLDEMATARSSLNIVILDACRNQLPGDVGVRAALPSSPGRLLARGFAEQQTGAAGTLIAYASAPGKVANDGAGDNGVFTGALLAELRKPGLPIEKVVKNAREAVVERTDGYQVPWLSSSAIGGDFIPYPDPGACLDRLPPAPAGGFDGDLRLGRVRWQREVMEPVLIRSNVDGDVPSYHFRNCFGGKSIEDPVSEAELELFDSALVARFVHQQTGGLESYRRGRGGIYSPGGEVEIALPGAGTMLEARRRGERYVEVTATDSVRIVRPEALREDQAGRKVAILLVATRDALKRIELEIWDDSWGDRPEDSRAEREITWWEPTRPGYLRVHPAAGSFEGLARRADEPVAEPEIHWDESLEAELRPLLARNVISLLIAGEPDHIELAAAMRKLAADMNTGAELDVATLESRWSGRRFEAERTSLEDAAASGRYWLLVRLYDLAAIMPDRIAGKVRRNYLWSLRLAAAGVVDSRFAKERVILETKSQELQTAQAIYQDQAAAMVRTLDFLGCLLEGSQVGSSRLEDSWVTAHREATVEAGLERLGVPLAELEGLNVGAAFEYLFQGFSLPADLRAAERNFLGSLSRGDPRVGRLVRSLRAPFEAVEIDPAATCRVVLIPDSVFLDRPMEPLAVVASAPAPGLHAGAAGSPLSLGEALEAEVRLAKEKARIALRDAIYIKGARHTKKKILRGHIHFDDGNRLLEERGTAAVNAAREAFEKAESLFFEAKKIAFQVEHELPKLRVH